LQAAQQVNFRAGGQEGFVEPPAVSGAFRASPSETMKGVCPPLEWLHVLFSGAEFPPGRGLYYIPRKLVDTVTADQYVLGVPEKMYH
jgi:hypothetical protein